ncbi:hypothetical protein EI94DRAFT_1444204, partial [Lactarius quietus]
TLISTTLMDQIGYGIGQKNCRLTIHTPEGKLIAIVPQVDGLYRVPTPGHVAAIAAGGDLVVQINDLHRRLGHVGIEACREAVQCGMVEGVKLVDPTAPAIVCEPCTRSKVAERSFPKESASPHASEYGGRVHSDLWGPAPVKSFGGREYMLTFTDE